MVAPSAELAYFHGVEPAAVARLATQCAPLLLERGAAALRLYALLPPDDALLFMAVLLGALQQTFNMAQKATCSGDKAAFLRHAPPAQVTSLLQATCDALAAVPAHMHHPGEGGGGGEPQVALCSRAMQTRVPSNNQRCC